MASDGHPLVTSAQFKEIIDRYGWNLRRRRRSLVRDCPCFDPKAKWADPDCIECEGTGSLEGYEDTVIKGILLFNDPDGYWRQGNIYTKAGIMERAEAEGFFAGGTDVRIGDFVLFTTSLAIAAEEIYEEFEVINLKPRTIGDGSGRFIHIFSAAGLRKISHDVAKEFPP